MTTTQKQYEKVLIEEGGFTPEQARREAREIMKLTADPAVPKGPGLVKRGRVPKRWLSAGVGTAEGYRTFDLSDIPKDILKAMTDSGLSIREEKTEDLDLDRSHLPTITTRNAGNMNGRGVVVVESLSRTGGALRPRKGSLESILEEPENIPERYYLTGRHLVNTLREFLRGKGTYIHIPGKGPVSRKQASEWLRQLVEKGVATKRDLDLDLNLVTGEKRKKR